MDKTMQVQEVSNTHSNNNTSSIHEHHQQNGPLPTTTTSGDGELQEKDGTNPLWKRQKISSGDNNNGANNVGTTMFNHDLYRYYPQHSFLDTLPNPAIYDNTSSLLQYFPQHATTTTTSATTGIDGATTTATAAARGVSNPLSEQTGGDFPPSEPQNQQQIPTYGSPAAANNHPYPSANGVTTLTATTAAAPPVPKDCGKDNNNTNSNGISNSSDNNGSENSQNNSSNGNNNNNTHNSNGGIPYQQIQHPNVAAMAASILMYQQQHASSQVQKQHPQHPHNMHLGISDPTQLAQHIAQIHPYYHINQQQQQQQQQQSQPPPTSSSTMTPQQQQEQQKQQAKENAAAVASAAAAIVARSKSTTTGGPNHPTNPPLTISNWPQPNVTMPLSYLSSLGGATNVPDSGNNSVSDDKDPNNNNPNSISTEGKIGTIDNEDKSSPNNNNSNDQSAFSDSELKKQKAREKNRIHSRNSRMRKKDSIIRLKQDNSHLQMYRIITEAMADMVSLHDLSDEARIIYANPSFIAKFAVSPIIIPPTPNTTPFQQVVNPPPTPHRRVPSCFLQLVHEEDVKALVDCLRLVRLDATQAPILSLRMLVSASPPAADGSLLYSMVQTRIQACAAVGTLLIVTRPLGSDGDYFRYLPSSVSAVPFNNVSPVASTGFVL